MFILRYNFFSLEFQFKLTARAFNQLKTNTPAVLLQGHTTTQTSLFLSQWWPTLWPVLTAPTHGGMARLSGPEWLGKGNTSADDTSPLYLSRTSGARGDSNVESGGKAETGTGSTLAADGEDWPSVSPGMGWSINHDASTPTLCAVTSPLTPAHKYTTSESESEFLYTVLL